MKVTRLTTPLLAGATVILLAANAFPTVRRKHRLQEERNRLVLELRHEQERGKMLRERAEAIAGDRFYLQRMLAETWRGVPAGAIEWRPTSNSD